MKLSIFTEQLLPLQLHEQQQLPLPSWFCVQPVTAAPQLLVFASHLPVAAQVLPKLNGLAVVQ